MPVQNVRKSVACSIILKSCDVVPINCVSVMSDMNYADENACRIAARCGIEASENFRVVDGITRDADRSVLWCSASGIEGGSLQMISQRSAMLQTLMISALIGGGLPAFAKSDARSIRSNCSTRIMTGPSICDEAKDACLKVV